MRSATAASCLVALQQPIVGRDVQPPNSARLLSLGAGGTLTFTVRNGSAGLTHFA